MRDGGDEHYAVAIVGSGPGGLSAAARAAERRLSHILLEKADHLADTIYRYQKGKLIMATPDILPLRSDLQFQRDIRENVLRAWENRLDALRIDVRYNAEVTGIKRDGGKFVLAVKNGARVTADKVILAIGLQGNIRQLQVPGCEGAPQVQYQLDDPDEYEAETIVVIGAGDSAIENAVALAKQNKVIIVNRAKEFARAKDGNLALILSALERGVLSCLYGSETVRLNPGSITMGTPDGVLDIPCDRIIARLGATAPRKFVESCGIAFPSADETALPEVSATYETNVPGLHIIGALAGYPLIKQAMNQGYEVIEFILGHAIKPADEPILEERFRVLGDQSVAEVFDRIRRHVPIFSELPVLVLRELMLDATIHRLTPGDVVFRRNEYSNSFYTVLDGTVAIEVDPADRGRDVVLGPGEFFGEMGVIAGRRRTATVRACAPCILIDVPRRPMIKLLNSFESVKRLFNQAAVTRQIRSYLAPNVPAADLAEAIATARVQEFKQNDVLFAEGEAGDTVHLISRGSVTVSRRIAGKETVLSYVPAGHYVGELALLSNAPRSATVRAAIATETVRIDGEVFKRLLARVPGLRSEIETRVRGRLVQNERMEQAKDAGGIIQFLVRQGIGEATDVLLIDEGLCTRCNNCEIACAETHGGISRLNREAGPTFANIHVPTSCRHCEHPHCMEDCPPDAIHRAPGGEVFIDDSCIGCGNCERNCPYGVIQMAAVPETRGGLWSWLFFGRGPGPGERAAAGADEQKVAVKCDMCKGIAGGPACVRACPTGAAIRVSPEEFLTVSALADGQ